jgi:hypothetical protein
MIFLVQFLCMVVFMDDIGTLVQSYIQHMQLCGCNRCLIHTPAVPISAACEAEAKEVAAFV